ncbi:hypothetical protein E8E13_001922 [Curvularia kusanoi]|uniref:DUF7918 domain-containing protein n=1 Tax=Curvularia kusanoi TaxID=90978 RepID=A0A9P4TA05_CURKU|nr:hypothetical protein E8E13_001922 [Curvularia kusanoi]
MAILEAHPGLTTEITVNKAPLTEYSDDEAEPSSTETTNYIEARSGFDFVIKTRFKEPFPAINGVEISVSVDGNRGPRWSVKPDHLFYRVPIRMKGVGFSQDGKRYHQNYQFAELNIVEESEEAVDISDLRKKVELKGCIEVSYRWITNFSTREKPQTQSDKKLPVPKDEGSSPPIPRRQLPTIDSIPEKVLKGDARSHQTILGEPSSKKTSSGPGSSYDYVDREPFGTMRFKYRSLASLKAMSVIVNETPTSQSESRLETEPPRTRARKRRAAHSTRMRNGRSNGIKPETEHQSRVKRELNDGNEVEEDSDDLTIVETRSCKRSRNSEIITLD